MNVGQALGGGVHFAASKSGSNDHKVSSRRSPTSQSQLIKTHFSKNIRQISDLDFHRKLAVHTTLSNGWCLEPGLEDSPCTA